MIEEPAIIDNRKVVFSTQSNGVEMADRLKYIAELFKSLGDENRLLIIKLLASSPDETLCVSDIAKTIKIT